MPDAPRFKLNASATFKVGRSESINRLAFYTFGPEELVNPDMASIDPNYKLEITNIDLISAEVFGQDQYDLTYSDAEKFTFDFVGDSVTHGLNHCTADETYVAKFAKFISEKYNDRTVLRYDGVGKSHGGVPTPHVHEHNLVRPANPWEIPKMGG